MKITDKVANDRLQQMFIAACAAFESDDPGGAYTPPAVVEQASVYSELLSARTALGLDPSHRIAAALERIADRLDSWDCQQNEQTKGHGFYVDGVVSASVAGEVSTT